MKTHKDNEGGALCGAKLPRGQKGRLTTNDDAVSCANCQRAINGNGRPVHLLIDGNAKCGANLGAKAKSTTDLAKATCANCLQERKPKVVHRDLDGKPGCGAKSGLTTKNEAEVTCHNCLAKIGGGKKKKEKAKRALEKAVLQCANAGLVIFSNADGKAVGEISAV